MKATELRIGNWYSSGIDMETGEQVHNQVVPDLYMNWHVNGCWAEPIPLTEEWLERFGFETECKWINDCRAVKGDFYITLDHDGATVIGYPTSVGMRNKWMFVQDIEYVHQLQNLYFAITGVELTKNK